MEDFGVMVFIAATQLWYFGLEPLKNTYMFTVRWRLISAK
jgi:hypothetical protein